MIKVSGASGGDASAPAVCGASADRMGMRGSGRGFFSPNGSAGTRCGSRRGDVGQDCSGRRKPIEIARPENPARRAPHPLSHPGLACAVQRCTGSTKPAGLLNGCRTGPRSAPVRGSSILIARVDVLGIRPCLTISTRILVSRLNIAPRCQDARNPVREMLRILGRWIVIGRFARDQAVVAPDRYAVAANTARRPSAAAVAGYHLPWPY